MGYFTRNANSAFKENPNGSGWLYYPNGASGKGRIVTNKKQKKKLFYFQKYRLALLILLGLIYGTYFSNHGVDIQSIIELIIFVLITYCIQYWLIKDLPKSNTPLTHHEAMLEVYKDKKAWSLYLYFLLNISVILMGISMPWILDEPFLEIYNFMLMVICLGIVGIAIGLRQKKYMKSNN